MNNLKLTNLFKDGLMVVPIYLLKNYKNMQLELNEFIFLMYLYHKGNNTIFNPSAFAKEINMDLEEVMEIISRLSDKKYINVEVEKNDHGLMEEIIKLDDFYNKISLMLLDDINKDEVDSSIFEIIEKEFGRTLSPIEYEIIKTWLDNNYNEDLIKEAVKEATFNGVSNLRYIDKILYEWSKKGINTKEDVLEHKKQRNAKLEEKENKKIDLEIMDWNWFEDEE